MLERRRVAAQYPPWTFLETVLIELLASRGKMASRLVVCLLE